MKAGRAAFAGTQRFWLKRELGAGGMGVVYEAFDREKEVTVALKSLKSVDAKALDRFKKEFRALQGLEHPNVVSLGELLEANGEWFFTMELVRGCDFLSYVWGQGVPESTMVHPAREASRVSAEPDRSTPVLDEGRLRSALRQLACGVVALHDRALVHRDVKPTNVLVTAEGRTVLMDFGLVTDTDTLRQSTAAHAIGTPAYMSPEQAKGDKVSPLSDWYSVGVVLYEALTGRLPFDGSSIHQLMDKLRHEPPAPSAIAHKVPADLDELCVDLLRRDPAQRPSTDAIIKRLGIEGWTDTSPLRSASLPISGSLSVSGSPSASGSHSIQTIPFVGRAHELSQLRAALDDVDQKPVVVLVEGESGMGKSALVEHFVESVTDRDRDAVVLRGRCYEREQVPYKAFDGVADSLSKLLLRTSSTDVARIMPLYPALLSLLFPVLRRVEAIARAPLIPGLPDPQAQRTRMLGAFREILLRLSHRSRLILILDDLQWTCADSLTLFEEVFGHEHAPPALILATLRPVNQAKREAIRKAMAMVDSVRSLSIDGLPVKEARELATMLMPSRSASEIQTLVSETGGHPLFVHELARHSQTSERGLSLDAALRARMVALPAHSRALLTVLCVAGQPITQEVAQLASDLDGTTFAKATSVLRAAYLARTDGSRTSDTVGPYHDRVREALVAILDDSQRMSVNAALATALERTGGDARAIVRHAIAGGMPARAVAHAEEAAQKASSTMAFDQAAELYETALTLGTQDPQTELRLRLARAEMLKSAGRGREAAEAFMLTVQVAGAAKVEPAVCIHCQTQAVEQWLISGNLDAGFAASMTLLAGISEPTAKTPTRALSSLLWNRMLLRLGRKTYPDRHESQIDRETLNHLDVLRAMAMGLTATDLLRSADFNARFLLRARRAGEPMRLVQGLGVEACYLAAQGGQGSRRARELIEQMKVIAARRSDDPYFAGYVLGIDGIVCMNEGRFVRATVLMEQAEQVFESLKSRNMLERNAVQLFRMISMRLAGSTSACRVATATFLRDAHRRGDTYFATTVHTHRTQDLLASDQPTQAAEYLAQAPWTPVEKGFHLQHYFALDAQGELCLYQGSAASALTALDEGLPHLQRSLLLRMRLLRIVYRWLHARLLLSAVAHDSNRTADRKTAGRIARQLEGEQVGCATVFALLIRAGQAALEPGPKTATVIDLLRQAVAAADEHEMASCAAAARYRLGNILGGDEGAAQLAEAGAWCTREGVVQPERYFEVIAPGFVPKALVSRASGA